MRRTCTPRTHPARSGGRALVFLAISLALASCLAQSTVQGSPSVLPSRPPRRIVSLLPSLTELVFDFGKGPDLVGIGDYCHLPPDHPGLPRLGGLQPNVEGIADLHPDLILADISQETALKPLQDSRVEIAIVPDTRAETIEARLEVILKVGGYLERSTEAENKVAEMRRAIDEVRRAIAERTPPRVLYVSSWDPLKIAGRDGIEHDIIRSAGGDNAGAGLAGGSAEGSDDFVARANPEVVLVSRESEIATVFNKPAWSNTEALVRRRVHVLDLRHHPDPPRKHWPTLVGDIKELARILHPQAFDPVKETSQ